jgi:YVTN family beta-propeller protein
LPLLHSRRVLIAVLGIAIILSYLYVPLNSTAQSSNLESSGISETPLSAAEASSDVQSSSSNIIKELAEGQSSDRAILSSDSNATNEAEDIEQCDDTAVPERIEKTIQSRDNNNNNIASPNFQNQTYEISNFDILGRISIQYPNDWVAWEAREFSEYPLFYPLYDPDTRFYLDLVKSPPAIKNLTLSNYLNYTTELRKEQALGQGLGFKLLNQTADAKLGIGNDAYLLEFEQQSEENAGDVLRIMETGMVMGDRVFYVVYIAETTRYSDYLPAIRSMIDSIKIERFDSYENLDLGIRFIYPPSWNKTSENENGFTVSFESPREDTILSSSLKISRVDFINDPKQYIIERNYQYNQSGYNTTQPAPIIFSNSLNASGHPTSGYIFNYRPITNTGSMIEGYRAVAIQDNISYEILYQISPTDYGISYFDRFQPASISSQYGIETEEDYDSLIDEFSALIDEFGMLIDSAQFFDAKRYEEGFYNNLAGIIIEYPSLHPYFPGDLSPNEISSIATNFTKDNPSYGNAIFDLELSVKPYNKSLNELDEELQNKLMITNLEIPDGGICKTQISNNLEQKNATMFHKVNLVSRENPDRKGLLFYGIYHNYSYLFNFTTDGYHFDMILPVVEEIFDSLKIVAPRNFEGSLIPNKHGLISEIVYPRNWQFTPQGSGFQITSLKENHTDNFMESLSLYVEAAGLDSLQDVASGWIGQAKQALNFQLVDSQESTLSNNSAHKIVYTYTQHPNVEGSCRCDVKEMVIFTIKDRKVYTLHYSAELDKFISYLPTIETILDSIKIQEKVLVNITSRSGLELNGGPVDLAINPVTNRLYVAIPEARQIQVIDGFTDQLIENITLGANPNAVALNPNTNKIYVASPETDMIYVIDGVTNNITAKIPAGPIVGDIAVDTNEFGGYSTLVFVANTGNNSISIIDDIKGRVVENIETGLYPFSVGIDSIKNRAYITGVTGLDIIDYTAMVAEHDVFANHSDTIGSDYSPFGIVVNSNTSRAYIANSGANTISVINTATNNQLYDIKVGIFPHQLAFNPIDEKLYAASSGNNTVSVIDTTKTVTVNSTVREIITDSIPYDVAINPNTNIIYLANYESETLSTIDSNASELVAALTFHINPSNAGRIECNEKEIPENSYQRIAIDTQCKAIGKNGYVFSSWSNGAGRFGSSTNSSFKVSQYGVYTANFSSPSEIIQTASPYISIGGLVLVVLLAAIKPTFHIRKNVNREKEQNRENDEQTIPNLPRAHRSANIEKDEKEKREEKGEVKEEDPKLLSRGEIVTIDATVLIGVLIFLTFTEGFEPSEQYQINVITASIVFPFAISAIIGVTRREKFATRLMIAGFINLMISIILIAVMKL